MDKRHLHHVWRRLKPINHWVFFGLFVVSGVIGTFAYRNNNLVAIKLRDEVLSTDKAGGDVETALRNLREYTYGHMNANLAAGTGIQQPIQLKYRYERLVQAEKDRVAATNAKVYTEAQARCEQLYPHGLSGGPRVPCIQQYVSEHGTKEEPVPDALYKFDFYSPVWTPDFAGWTLLSSGIFFALFIVRFSLERWFRFEMHQNT